ncbi:hypothetical protein [Streptomyces chryseus]|uniref:hypothetical protein n=1 Tax=Streptomyces chryseus TaxID=68186 RepID=UPI00110F93EC|nr:hypothetical protein [Streptomyces chryseus]GGX25219.1 hypothetical protein GCM10010353_45180 [Streptomyces chryseus]
MGAFKDWLDRSLAGQATLVFLLGTGITALFRRDEHPVYWVAQGGLYAAVVVTVLAVQRRKVGRAVGTDPRALAELNRKIRHREVPSEPEEQATMRRLVTEQLRQMERGGRWLPYWLGFMGLVAVGMLVLGAATGSLGFPLVFTVGVICFCFWVLWMRRRSVDHCRSMHAALHGQEERVS